VSREGVELVARGYEQFRVSGEIPSEFVAPDFVWDMSKFRGWPEQQLYEGIEGTRKFIRDWSEAWDDWELEVEALHDAGERIVAVLRQHGRSKATGLTVGMHFAQVWIIREGKQARMEMYADPAEALAAVGLSA
jgi:ketosteroid isomerase-like protein